MSKDSRKDSDKDRHMPILEHGADTLQRVEIITGTGRRRRWSLAAPLGTVVLRALRFTGRKQKRAQITPPRMGVYMTFLVAFLICVSAAVFLAHAFDAYHAG
jgi:hypothetical protein